VRKKTLPRFDQLIGLRAIRPLLALFLYCLSAIVCPLPCCAQSDTITVGVLLDLSGPGSLNGAAAYKAIRLAAEQINAQGGVKGKRLNIAVFNTQGLKNQLLSGAKRLELEFGASVLLGPTDTSNVMLLRRYAESNKIPLILIQGIDPIFRFTGTKTNWTFSTTVNFDAELKALFSYFRSKDYETLGGLMDNTETTRKIGLWIRGYAPEYGMKITCLGRFNPNQEDIGMKFEYLSRCAPDITLIWASWASAPLVKKDLKRMDVPMALSHQLFSPDPHTLSLPVGSLIYAAVPPILFWQYVPRSSLSYFPTMRFIDAWGSEFQSMAPEQQLAAGQAWDGLRLACRAISSAANLSHRAIRTSLEKKMAPFAGVMGVFSPNKRDHSGLSAKSLLLLRCMGSHWSLVRIQ